MTLCLEIQPDLELELPGILEVGRIRNRSAFRWYEAKRIRTVDVQNAAADEWRRAKSDAIYPGLWVVEHVFRIHADRCSQVLANPDPLGKRHVGAPGSSVLQRVQADVASCARQRILKDDLSVLRVRHS